MDVPAWCKEVVDIDDRSPIFIGAAFNYAYEIRYEVSEDAYIGKTDFDIHPESVASQYYSNDMITYVTKKYHTFAEAGRQDNDPLYASEERFAKLWVELPVSGRDFICGYQITHIIDPAVAAVSP